MDSYVLNVYFHNLILFLVNEVSVSPNIQFCETYHGRNFHKQLMRTILIPNNIAITHTDTHTFTLFKNTRTVITRFLERVMISSFHGL